MVLAISVRVDYVTEFLRLPIGVSSIVILVSDVEELLDTGFFFDLVDW